MLPVGPQFRTLAVAIAYSPRREALLCEARRLQVLFNANLVIFHVGEAVEHRHTALENLMDYHDFDEDKTQVVWVEGYAPKLIPTLCGEYQVDLLIAGAMPSKSVWAYYRGSIARKLVSRAPCSVLLMRFPNRKPKPLRRVGLLNYELRQVSDLLVLARAFAKAAIKDGETTRISLYQELARAMQMPEFASKADKLDHWRALRIMGRAAQSYLKATCSQVKLPARLMELKFAGRFKDARVQQWVASHKMDLVVVNEPKLQSYWRLRPRWFRNLLFHMPNNLMILKLKTP